MTSVVSRSEAGRRGYEQTLANHGKAAMDRWRRSGGRKPNLTLIEINELEREQAATRRQRRVSSKSGGAMGDS